LYNFTKMQAFEAFCNFHTRVISGLLPGFGSLRGYNLVFPLCSATFPD